VSVKCFVARNISKSKSVCRFVGLYVGGLMQNICSKMRKKLAFCFLFVILYRNIWSVHVTDRAEGVIINNLFKIVFSCK